MAKPSVLIVEDDDNHRQTLIAALRDLEVELVAAASAEEALARLQLAPVDVVVSDVVMGRLSGMDLLGQIRKMHPDTAVILVTGHGSIDAAVRAIRGGAYDYITKPVELDHLQLVLGRALHRQDLIRENRRLRDELQRRFSTSGIVGRSASLRRVLERAEQAAETHATVLITGESGTGKELIARAIHNHSRRSEARMVCVNCAALPESVVESELFGHERGAFTDAHQMRRGRFEQAHGGTLFLDEVGDLSPQVQVKLLRVLQEREFERVGGQTAIQVDIRLIAATNQDLTQLIEAGRLREDFYYRLRVVTIEVPPLRDRREDIPLLLEHFREQFCQEHARNVERFTPEALQALCAYSWRGNVRELRNLVESLVVTTRGGAITAADLPSSVLPRQERPGIFISMGKALSDVERLYVLETLKLLDGNKFQAARALGISKKTLYRRLEEYGEQAQRSSAEASHESADPPDHPPVLRDP